MTQKQHEALNEGDLDQNVSETDGDKIEQWERRLARRPPLQRQRQNQKREHRDHRNDQHQQQDQDAEIYLPVDAVAQSLLAENLAGFSVKKKNGALSFTGATL